MAVPSEMQSAYFMITTLFIEFYNEEHSENEDRYDTIFK